MPLLLVLLGVVGLLALWAVLLPLSLWMRYRTGKARRRAFPWAVRMNVAALLLSVALFLPSMALTSLWWPGAFSYAAAGLTTGALLGWGGLKAGRFENTGKHLFYNHHPWIVLGLTLLVVARLALVGVELWRHWQGGQALAVIPKIDHASLFAVAGVLLGYHTSFNLGLRRRLPQSP
jgi:hypothetical protein